MSVTALIRDVTTAWESSDADHPSQTRQFSHAFDRLALVGQGAFAEVWRIRDAASMRHFALKQLRADCPNRPVGQQLLLNEAEIAARFESEHVVRLEGTQSDGDTLRLVFEWLEGETLESRLAETGPLNPREALWITRQCVQGLSDLLAAGFTHGDVKPSNIFLCRSGLVKLIDLGFARPDQRIVDDLASPPVMGTPEYLASDALVPAEQNGVARDVYALGVTLYRSLTGVLPFQGGSVADVMRRQQTRLPRRPRSLSPHVPGAVERLIERLLSKQPLRRPTGLKSLLHELVGLELECLDWPA